MLLRYVVLHGVPVSEEDWAAYKLWKQAQLALAECEMTQLEGEPSKDCLNCPGRPDCTKADRRKT